MVREFDGLIPCHMRNEGMEIDKAIEECPLLEHYIGGGEFTGFSAKELPTAMTEELPSVLTKKILPMRI